MCVSPYSWASSVRYIRWLISSDYITFVANAPLIPLAIYLLLLKPQEFNSWWI